MTEKGGVGACDANQEVLREMEEPDLKWIDFVSISSLDAK